MNKNNSDVKKVFLLTNKFPYGIVETFIEAELDALPDDIELTIIPTQPHAENDAGRPVPPHVHIDDFLCHRSKIETVLKTFRAMFSDNYRLEIKERKAAGSVSIADRIHLAGYFGRAYQIADAMRKKYGDELVGSTLYSYWLMEASYAEMLLKKRYNCKCVSRAHRVDIYDGRCAYETIPGQRQAAEGIDRIYVCSKDGMRYLQAKYPECADRFSYAYLGTADYGFKTDDSRKDEFVIASCSRLVSVKRVHLIAEALSKITDRAIRWVHIGDGPEKERVEEALKKMSGNVTVELLGNRPHDEVMSYYGTHNIDLFLNVSQSEGLPVSIMEVISFGVPVIATDVGGTGEIVQPETGVLIPMDFSVDDLADMIRRYIDTDNDKYVEVRKNVRTFWEKNFSAETNYQSFYREITKHG